MSELVLATRNAGKIAEVQRLISVHAPHIKLRSVAEFDLEDVEETGVTFEENALLKATTIARHTGLPALADDSGICVQALDNRPGVYSARYAGEPANDAANNQKLIKNLQEKTNRGAHYVCALVFVNGASDPEPLIVQTRWYGKFIDEAKGANGFGYDPHFFLPELGLTAAELSSEQKNAISHRGQALRELINQLQSRKEIQTQRD